MDWLTPVIASDFVVSSGAGILVADSPVTGTTAAICNRQANFSCSKQPMLRTVIVMVHEGQYSKLQDSSNFTCSQMGPK